MEVRGSQFRPSSGERIYAVGDMHGREDLFVKLTRLIRADAENRTLASSKIIVLGDFIDRGPSSAAIVRRLMRYTAASDRFIVLRGNHEQLMVSTLNGEHKAFASWLKLGGAQTLLSFGVPAEDTAAGPSLKLLNVIQRAIGPEVEAWLRARPLWHLSGEIVFVHAGVRPGASLEDQDPDDLLWGCREFYRQEERHPYLVVHGDNILDDGPERRGRRIAVDTGAYLSDQLTAVGLEEDASWFITT